MGEPIESSLNKLFAKKIITLPDNQPFDPKINPLWWNENEFCEYHKSNNHKTSNCHKLKNLIQDLIDNGAIEVDGHTSNENM